MRLPPQAEARAAKNFPARGETFRPPAASLYTSAQKRRRFTTDRNEFARLLYADKARYYRIAWSYVKNEHDALDIMSEAACRGLGRLHTLKNAGSFRAWMTRIVVNCAIDFLRSGSREVYLEDAAPQAASIPAAELMCEDSLDLYAALDALSARERTAIVLKYFEGYSFREAGEILGESESAVKSRVFRALKKMRSYLEEGGR